MTPAKRKKRTRTPDPVEVQLSIKVRRRVNKRGKALRITKDLIDDAVMYWAEEGESPDGFDISVVRWRNPARKNPALRQWRTALTDDQKNCDLIRRMLRSGRVKIKY